MGKEDIDKIYALLDNMKVTEENKELIEETRECLKNEDMMGAFEKIQMITSLSNGKKSSNEEIEEVEDVDDSDDVDDQDYEEENEYEESKEPEEDESDNDVENNTEEDYDGEDENEDEELEEAEEKKENKKEEEEEKLYPNALSNVDLEHLYIGTLLNNPKLIMKFYFLYPECAFEDDMSLNIYKSVLFTEGSKFTPEKAKQGFNFARDTQASRQCKSDWKYDAEDSNVSMEKIYIELKKLFVLRKAYLDTPVQELQDKIVEITSYLLYDQMSIEEIQSAVKQVNDTGKFKRAIISEGLTSFLEEGENNLTNGLALPFPIISSVFKGIRKGETMAFAMPSNSGKSRFTINLAAYTALVHQKKVLIISNEMSEEKMRLCLITTILNNPDMQKIHGQKLDKTEGELLEFKFRPDDTKNVKVDEKGFIIQEEKETRQQFVERLEKVSSEFNSVIKATEWANKQINNSIYFINITDHTNDELKKVIMNYYYKEKIEYIFYDTLKTDTDNIGNGEELKKTATILSNLAQNFNIFICSTLQLAESSTLPVNLTVNDLAVSRTVKEVLDTLCLIKQINRENYKEYEYSLEEVDTKFFDIELFSNPDVRYYACVVDKNRAGAKPRLLFRLNLAYNKWEELGYLRLKQS